MKVIKTVGDWALLQSEETKQYPDLPIIPKKVLTPKIFKTCPFLNFIFIPGVKIHAILLLGSTITKTRTAYSDYDLNIIADVDNQKAADELAATYHISYCGRIIHWHYNTWDSLIKLGNKSIVAAAGAYQFYFLNNKYLLYKADDWDSKWQVLLDNKMLISMSGIYYLYENLLLGIGEAFKKAYFKDKNLADLKFKKFYYHLVVINSIINSTRLDLKFVKRIKSNDLASLSRKDLIKLAEIIDQYEKKMLELNININELEAKWVALE